MKKQLIRIISSNVKVPTFSPDTLNSRVMLCLSNTGVNRTNELAISMVHSNQQRIYTSID
jgi:hypothetical protein